MTSIQLLKSVILAFQRTYQPSSVTSSSAIFSAGDRPATPQQGHSGRSDKDIAAGFRALRPSYQSQSAPKQSAATSNSMEVQQGQPECRGDLFVIMAAFTRPDLDQNDVAAIARAIDPPDRPWDARRLAFLIFLIFAVGGASALLSRAMLRPSTTRVAHEVETTPAPRPVTATAPSSILDEQTGSIKPAQVEPVPAAMAPSAPRGSSIQAKPVPGFHPEQQAMTNEPAPAAMTPQPPNAPPSGEASNQKPVLGSRPEQQAMTNEPTQQAEPAPAAMTPQPPNAPPSGEASIQAKPVLGSRTEQQAMTNEPAQQEPAPAAMTPPPMAAPQPSRGVRTQAEAAPVSSSEHQAIASVSGPQPTPAQGSSTALNLESLESTTLIERGSAFLKRGDLASARLLLWRAADSGSANAALMLGSTYDPLIIQQRGVIGIEPDVARARHWYEKAAELGSDAASQRLANLKNQ
jgi:hypothetical protein